MAKLRPALHLALALTLASLTCDFGAVCAMAGMDGCCCPVAAGTPPPCTDVSGDRDMPGAQETPAALDAGERFSAAVLDGVPVAAAPGATASPADARAGLGVPAPATPLYLSHCAFLC